MELIHKFESLNRTKVILVIFGIGFFVYFNSLFNGFVWDDEEQIVNNFIIRDFRNLPLVFTSSTFNTGGAGLSGWYYKPLMVSSFMFNYSVWGFNPFGYHFLSVILHLLNSVLIYVLFLKIIKHPLFSFLGALLFLVHPVNVESVAYVSATQEVLFTFFVLSGFCLLLRFQEKKAFVWASFLIFLGLLSKETAVLAIPVIFVYFLLFKRERLNLWVFSSLTILACYLVLRLGIAKIPFAHFSIVPISEATLGQRLLTIPWEIIYYLRVLFFPKNLAISQHTVINNPFDFSFWGFGLISLISILLIIFLNLKLRSKNLLFFTFWFFISILLVLNIFPLDMTVAERWLYFPMIGLLGIGGVIAEKNKERLGVLGIVGIFGIVALLGMRTIVRNTNWYDGLSLYSHDIKYSQNAFDLENNLGVELFRNNKIDEAEKHFENSVKLQPKWWTSTNNLGAIYEKKLDFPAAEDQYKKAISHSDYYLAYENLGFLLLKEKKGEEAVSFLAKAILRFPQNSKLRAALALALYQEGKQLEAEREAKNAYTLEPSEQNQLILKTILDKKPVY